MTEQPLIQALRAKVDKRIAVMEAEAVETVQSIEEDAEAMMAEIRSQAEADTDALFQEFRAEQQALHDNEQRDRQRDLQHRLVHAVFEEVDEQLDGLRGRPDYPEVWPRLYQDALNRYHRDDPGLPRVHVHPDDVPLAIRCGIQEASIVPDPSLNSGVVLADPHQRFRIVNTPESRLQRGREEFVKMIADARRRGSS